MTSYPKAVLFCLGKNIGLMNGEVLKDTNGTGRQDKLTINAGRGLAIPSLLSRYPSFNCAPSHSNSRLAQNPKCVSANTLPRSKG
jgi:hypothetical protein